VKGIIPEISSSVKPFVLLMLQSFNVFQVQSEKLTFWDYATHGIND
jgi:hypothetical protein